MSHTFLANFWFFALALVWAIYVIQEMFVTGAGMLGLKFLDDESRYKKFNAIIGTHWDGIQVWLILAIGGLFATFPNAYATTLTALYIPIFLLLYCIIFRGLSIELIYKTDNKKMQKIMKYTWAISSLVLILVVGTYLTNLFTGLPISNGTMNDTFFSFIAIFSPAGLAGGVMFVLFALVQGYLFLTINTSTEITNKFFSVAKWAIVVGTLVLIFLMIVFNLQYESFSDDLYTSAPIFYALPFLAISLAIITIGLVWSKRAVLAFISLSLATLMYIFTGFSASFPYIVLSTTDKASSLLIVDAAATTMPLQIMMIATLIFLPIVIAYQLFKYIKYWGDIHEN
ncbi:MAG: cytochrome d ubiquinol oxidase subunit II [Mycoplasmatales bacterium]